MTATLMVGATLATSVLIPRLGPKPVVPLGMGLAAAGMVWLTGLDLSSSYTTGVLPPLLVAGIGLGLVIAPAMSLAVAGVDVEHSGVASATVNAMQQVGGSIGTALLNTLATSAATDHLVAKTPGTLPSRPRPAWRPTPPPTGGRQSSSPSAWSSA